MHRISSELTTKLRPSDLSIREYPLVSSRFVEDEPAVLADLPATLSSRHHIPAGRAAWAIWTLRRTPDRCPRSNLKEAHL